MTPAGHIAGSPESRPGSLPFSAIFRLNACVDPAYFDWSGKWSGIFQVLSSCCQRVARIVPELLPGLRIADEDHLLSASCSSGDLYKNAEKLNRRWRKIMMPNRAHPPARRRP